MAEYPGFVGDSYQARSYSVSPARVVNWYPEIVESPADGKVKVNFYPTPGLTLHSDCSALGPGRAAFALNGRQWAVIGTHLVEFYADGGYVPIDGLADDGSNPAYIDANAGTPTQLMIASGGQGYIFDLTANTLTQITGGVGNDGVTPGVFNGCVMPAFLDNYLIALEPDSRVIQISALGQGLNWDANDVSANLGSADNVKAIICDHEYLYQLGSKRTAVYTNSGNADFPIVPVPGAFIEQGIRAIASLKRFNNTIVFYGQNEAGRGGVFRLNGFIPERISTAALEWRWAQYPQDDDAVALTQVRDGHGFYRITFPSGNETFVFDLQTKLWHERAVWDQTNAVYDAQVQRYGAYSEGVYYVVGIDGNIYREENGVYTDNGAIIRRLRIPPALASRNKMLFVSRFEVIVQPGIGLSGDPAATQGVDPLMMLRYSGDGGQTWSSEMTASAGIEGDYEARLVYDQLGSGRAWVPEITVTDPVNWVLLAAEVEMAIGNW
jgi:hypothetical protein